MKKIFPYFIQILLLNPSWAFASVTSQGSLTINGYQEMVGVIRPQDSVDWSHGQWAVFHNENKGALGIEVLNPTAATRAYDSLLLEESNLKTERYKAWRCHSGQCQEAKITKISLSEYDLDLGSLQIRLRDYGKLCKESKEPCQYFISSWALTALAQSENKASPIAPKILFILKNSDKISLIDAESKETWLNLTFSEESPIQKLGTLKRAHFQPAGKLLIEFSLGSLLLDFAHDLALISDLSANLSVLESGLGQGDLNQFKSVYRGNHERLLLLGGFFVITHRQAQKFEWSFNKVFNISERFSFIKNWNEAMLSASDTNAVALKSESENGQKEIASLRLNPESEIEEQNLITISDPSFKKIVLEGTSIYKMDQELQWRNKKNQWVNILTGIQNTEIRLLEHSFFFTRKMLQTSESTSCEWVHMHQVSDEKFTEDSFITAPCNARFQAYEASDQTILGSWYSNNNISWKVWWRP